MEITGSTELLGHRLVGRELTPEAGGEVRGRVHTHPEGVLCDGLRQICVRGFARSTDEAGTVVALLGKSVG